MEFEKAIVSLLFGEKKDTNILFLNCPGELVAIHGKFLQTRSVVKADIGKVPFKDNRFGLIVIKGIINNFEMPIKYQKEILQNIFGLLRSGGILYFGIENRLSPAFFTKNKTSLININAKWRNANNIFTKFLHLIYVVKYYRTHLLSSSGYSRLLRKSGFRDIFLYSAPNGFNHPCILSLEKSAYNYYCSHLDSPRKAIKEFFIRLLNVLGANKYFCYSYILIGRKREV